MTEGFVPYSLDLSSLIPRAFSGLPYKPTPEDRERWAREAQERETRLDNIEAKLRAVVTQEELSEWVSERGEDSWRFDGD